MAAENRNDVVRIDLTPAQQRQIKEATDRNADAIELTVVELEARIAPRLAANHNQTMLVDLE
jgi:hypothetical protein